MTVCFFNSVKSWGGGEKWHLETCLFLHQQGHRVLFIGHNHSELSRRLAGTGVKYKGINVGNLSFLNPIKKNSVKNILIRHNVGCIVINLSRDLKLAGIAARKAGVEKIVYRRGSAIPIRDNFLNRYYFKKVVTHVLANSQATKNTVLENNENLFPKEKITVIYNGLAIEEFLNNSSAPTYSSEDKEEVTLVNLGRLEKQKNQKFLIYLAAELKKRKLPFKLLIGGEGSLENDLKTLATEQNVSDVILFTGFVENPRAFIESGAIFLLSSLWEGFGYVLAEAGLCKKPVVAFNTSSTPEVILADKTGYLTEVDNVSNFADKVEELILSPQLRLKMGEAAFEHINQTFDAHTILKKIETYLIDAHSKKTKLTALLITFNESHHIEEVLDNISFADEIIVVDSFSTDGTVEKIKQHKNVKFIQREFKNYTDQKSFAMKQASNDWILFLDADERLTPKLRSEIIKVVTGPKDADAYFFYRIFMFKKQVLRFSGWQSDKNYRLFRKSKVNFAESRIVHETLVVDGTSKVLKNKLIHYSYRDYEDYKGKMLKYGKMKAFEELDKGYTPNFYHFYLRPFYKFFNHYFLRLGFLDGKKGLIICYLNALGVSARYRELARLSKNTTA